MLADIYPTSHVHKITSDKEFTHVQNIHTNHIKDPQDANERPLKLVCKTEEAHDGQMETRCVFRGSSYDAGSQTHSQLQSRQKRNDHVASTHMVVRDAQILEETSKPQNTCRLNCIHKPVRQPRL